MDFIGLGLAGLLGFGFGLLWHKTSRTQRKRTTRLPDRQRSERHEA